MEGGEGCVVSVERQRTREMKKLTTIHDQQLRYAGHTYSFAVGEQAIRVSRKSGSIHTEETVRTITVTHRAPRLRRGEDAPSITFYGPVVSAIRSFLAKGQQEIRDRQKAARKQKRETTS